MSPLDSVKPNESHITNISLQRYADRSDAGLFHCVGAEPGSLPKKVRKGEGEPPSNYDISGHDKIRMDGSISRVVPFQRNVVDKKKMIKRIDSITKDLKIPRDKPQVGHRL